jgi:hypothetical protein
VRVEDGGVAVTGGCSVLFALGFCGSLISLSSYYA